MSELKGRKISLNAIHSEPRFKGVPMIWPLKRVHVFTFALFLLLANTSISLPDAFVNGEKKTTIMIANGNLSVLFRDNFASPQVLSGIQSLFNKKVGADFDAYDPDSKGASAGMNFEHIISGHRSQLNKFTPRRGRYDLFNLSDSNSVVLVRISHYVN